jgi:hypothetical protein
MTDLPAIEPDAVAHLRKMGYEPTDDEARIYSVLWRHDGHPATMSNHSDWGGIPRARVDAAVASLSAWNLVRANGSYISFYWGPGTLNYSAFMQEFGTPEEKAEMERYYERSRQEHLREREAPRGFVARIKALFG